MITTVEKQISATGGTTDYRWKCWGKVITGPSEIDLTKTNGYSLAGKFVQKDESVALGENEFLVCAWESGSRKNKAYKYRLFRGANSGTEIVRVTQGDREWFTSKRTEKELANAENSLLYAYALYMDEWFKHNDEAARKGKVLAIGKYNVYLVQFLDDATSDWVAGDQIYAYGKKEWWM